MSVSQAVYEALTEKVHAKDAEIERLREENNALAAREAGAESAAMHLGALVDELRGALQRIIDLAGPAGHDEAEEVRVARAALAGTAVHPAEGDAK